MRTKTEDCKQNTVKKQRYIGNRTLFDPDTGEMIPMQLIQVEDRDFNFHKVWLKNLILSLDGITNQKLRLAFWILEHLDSENKLVMTQRAIAKRSGISLSTVIATMKSLQTPQNENTPAFLQKINSGAYRVNPDVIYKGAHGRRMGIIYDYSADANATQMKPDEEGKVDDAEAHSDQYKSA